MSVARHAVHGAPIGAGEMRDAVAVLTVLNQKGGVGKTSTCHHLSGTLALLGQRVLLVDNDPQASLTQGFFGPIAARGLDPATTIAAVLAGELPEPSRLIRPTGIAGVDLLPASGRAASYNVPDPHLTEWDTQVALRDFLAEVRGTYDLIMIDCPPNLHLCSWSALVASDYVLVPLQPEDYGAQGIADVQASISRVQAGPNPSLKLLGFLDHHEVGRGAPCTSSSRRICDRCMASRSSAPPSRRPRSFPRPS